MADQRAAVLAIGVVFSSLSLVAIGLRCYARRLQRARLGVDDWLMVVAEVLALAISADYFVCYALADLGGVGVGFGFLDPAASSEKSTFGVTLWVFQILAVLCLGLIKLSTLCFYSRIFAIPRFRFWNRIVIGLTTAWTVAFFFASVFECRPIDVLWTAHPGGVTCVDALALFGASYTTATLLAILVVVLPIYQVAQLQIATPRKVGLSLVFTLSAVTIVASIMRTVAIYEAYRNLSSHDLPYYFAPVAYWSIIQLHLGIVASSLPSMAPIFVHTPVSRFFGAIFGGGAGTAKQPLPNSYPTSDMSPNPSQEHKTPYAMV